MNDNIHTDNTETLRNALAENERLRAELEEWKLACEVASGAILKQQDEIVQLRAELEAARRDAERDDARAHIVGDKIVIAISFDGLANAAQFNDALAGYDNDNGHYKPPIVTDKVTWAREIARYLNDEEEDGTTRIHLMIDSAMAHAIDQGAEGIVIYSDENYAAIARGDKQP